ncbi:hypothetical protein FNV43_RR14254 [Rhamnella rubrinervis]|uniref:NAC domain-containing protein n=1 Tax=Rhamnella rubrinervis TaxID=2594499 RepID=A0A8K0MG58_9ROSA|nr:hypothetical protein FNV43_RR14254 [Rhamnella rubrinervis]
MSAPLRKWRVSGFDRNLHLLYFTVHNSPCETEFGWFVVSKDACFVVFGVSIFGKMLWWEVSFVVVGGSMSLKTWLVNSRAIAKKVRNATRSSAYQIKDYGANWECPKCHCRIDNSDGSSEWPGLPAGVKFDPSDTQLLEHLAAKCGFGNLMPHMFIDEFIPTLEGEGIYCDHPENLPGAKKDGSSVHFFHRIINAYSTGQRKRRKIHSQHSVTAEHVRWHKTGKTKAVVENGVQKGWKKIMVLYKSSKKGSKPDKSNWVMHQYHLGTDEDEKEGEYVVSKISYQQQKQIDKNDKIPLQIEDSDIMALQTSPRTPNTNPPIPPRHGKSILRDDVADDNKLMASAEEGRLVQDVSHAPQPNYLEDDVGYPAWLAGESQAIENDLTCLDDTLLCKEDFDSGLNYMSHTGFASNTNELANRSGNTSCGIADLQNLELDTPPDFQLAAKKKVALLLQKLKKYELPELPPPRHDPELLTSEQLQAYKKIGFRNKNYVPVGVRGVFGGVVQNMHLHWKFHETVQVCCDNFPKEKIKQMATMLARLSGGIVVNIHNVKTIIMFRGRNYRQPKNLIPINTLTKRKALFKARFEQALESQKLNIKKIEQELRRSGINPEDPAATASIQRVAASFFNAIDKKDGSPYVFHGDKLSLTEPDDNLKLSEPTDEKEQEELDKFIAEIEDAAEREWAAEEAAEKQEFGKIKYWNREEFGGRFGRSETLRGDSSDDEGRGARHWKNPRGKHRTYNSDDDDGDDDEDEDDDADDE